jgi:hypothetical protein
MAMTAKRSPVQTEEQRRARVLPHVDRARRIAAMLDRWEQDAGIDDEPDWEANDVERVALRAPRP